MPLLSLRARHPSQHQLLDRAAALPARAGGSALALGIRALGSARPTRKPLHPRGRYATATLTRSGGGSTGVRWLDEPGRDTVVVRRSRALGLPQGWPDIPGIAVRIETGGGSHADLLFATTGLGRVSRFVLTAASAPDDRPYTTLLPYRGPRGPVVLGLRPESPVAFELVVALGLGPWTPIGRLDLTGPYDGSELSFDPVSETLPDLPCYAWVRALRRPSYQAARRHRETSKPLENA